LKGRSTISAVINTRNEQERIADAIRSVLRWVDEVVVVDMQSEDATVDIARALGALVHTVDNVGYVEPARQFGIEVASGDWILILDADEMVPRSLATRLTEIASRDEVDVVVHSRLNYFMGTPLANTGFGLATDRQSRFFRKGAVTFSDQIHHTAVRDGARLLDLPAVEELAVVHFPYDDISHFIAKLDRYTTIEARLAQRNGAPSRGRAAALLRAARAFRARFVHHKGHADGYRGLCMAWLMATYTIVTWAKARQLAEVGDREAIRGRYADVAARVLADYETAPVQYGRNAPVPGAVHE